MKRLLFVSLRGSPDRVPAEVYRGLADGDNDCVWTANRLGEAGIADRIRFDHVDVGFGDRLPSPERYDGVILGGSYHNVNEGHDWQRRTMEWVAGWRENGRPLLGICGGHQMAAVVLGGSVEPMKGAAVHAETAPVELTPAGRSHYLFDGLGERPLVHFAHFDHVERMPAGASVLATYNGTVAAADFGGDWLSVQFHPEMREDVLRVAWDGALPPAKINYRSSPHGAPILANFLKGTGLA